MSAEITEIFLKILKFGMVGASGLVIDFGLTWLLKEKSGIHKYVANAAGFCSAATSNFFLNRLWTFGSTASEVTDQFTRFFLIALAGLLLNTIIIWIAHQKKGMNFFAAKGLAVVLVMIWNFTMNFLFNFRQV